MLDLNPVFSVIGVFNLGRSPMDECPVCHQQVATTPVDGETVYEQHMVLGQEGFCDGSSMPVSQTEPN